MSDDVDDSRSGAGAVAPEVPSIVFRLTAIGLCVATFWTAWDLHSTLSLAGTLAARGADGLRIVPARASASELELVPGIGPATAARIVGHRDRHGVESLQAEDAEGGRRWTLDVVSGVGPITARRAAPYLTRPDAVRPGDSSAVRP